MKNKAQTTFITILLLGIVLCIVMYMYFYNPTKEKTATLEGSNAALQTRVDTLEKFYQEMPDNKKKIADMTSYIQSWIDIFPADVMEEDTIYFALKAMNLEGLQEMYDEGVIPEDERMEIPAPADEESVVISFPSIGISAQERLATVDGELVLKTKIDGLNDGINLMKRGVTYVNSTSYEGLKCLIQTINSDPEKKTLSSLNYSVDEFGLLSGSVSVAFYSLEGTDKEYEPKDLSEYLLNMEYGLDNLFVKTEE